MILFIVLIIFLLSLILISFLVLCYELFRITSARSFWTKHGFPTVNVKDSLWKILWDKIPSRLYMPDIYNHGKEAGLPCVGYLEYNTPALMILDLDLIRSILGSDFKNFMTRKHYPNLDSIDPIHSKMLFFVEKENWRDLRRDITPTFTPCKIKRMIPILDQVGVRLVEFISSKNQNEENEVCFMTAIIGYVMDSIGNGVLSFNPELLATTPNPANLFREKATTLSTDILSRTFYSLVLMIVSPFLAKVIKKPLMDPSADVYFKSIFLAEIEKRRRNLDPNAKKVDDLIQLMIQNPNNTNEIIYSQMLNFLAAGENFGGTIMFLLFELAMDLSMQEKLYEEIMKFPKLTYETINSMNYLDQAINETLRKYTPQASLERHSENEYPLAGTDFVIPKNVTIRIPIYSIHMDPEYYPNPTKFDPNRFDPGKKHDNHPLAFLPFGYGERNCLGMRFSVIGCKIGIAHIIRNFKLMPCTKTPKFMDFGNTDGPHFPVYGLYLSAIKRNETLVK